LAIAAGAFKSAWWEGAHKGLPIDIPNRTGAKACVAQYLRTRVDRTIRRYGYAFPAASVAVGRSDTPVECRFDEFEFAKSQRRFA
jgi:hypothetical protein